MLYVEVCTKTFLWVIYLSIMVLITEHLNNLSQLKGAGVLQWKQINKFYGRYLLLRVLRLLRVRVGGGEELSLDSLDIS